jgi:two-component system nitrogen regulation response regulator GlnG
MYSNKLYINNLSNLRDIIIQNKINTILIDEHLIDNTINFLSEINTIKNKISIILISNNNLYNLNLSAFNNLDIKIIQKPFSFLKLKSCIDDLINRNKSNAANNLNVNIINLEKTEKTKPIYDAIIKIVKNNLNVLIAGENGTGKHHIALTINNLIAKNKILELNYFDYRNNEFNLLLLGKISVKKYLKYKKISLFSCILFSDIDEMPQELQLLLYNELKNRNNKSESLFKEKKIIATTSKNIKNILRNNNFSNELFYQLDMYNIYTLPLRERSEDIELLVKSFIFEFNSKNDVNKQLDLDSFLKLSSYLWPGNIKQLKNFIIRILNISPTNLIDQDLVAKEISNEFTYDEKNYIDSWKLNFRTFISRNIKGYLNNLNKIDSGFYYKILKDFEKPLLIETLKYTNYNQLLSAELLGINRNTLRKKMFDYDIQVTKNTSG